MHISRDRITHSSLIGDGTCRDLGVLDCDKCLDPFFELLDSFHDVDFAVRSIFDFEDVLHICPPSDAVLGTTNRGENTKASVLTKHVNFFLGLLRTENSKFHENFDGHDRPVLANSPANGGSRHG